METKHWHKANEKITELNNLREQGYLKGYSIGWNFDSLPITIKSGCTTYVAGAPHDGKTEFWFEILIRGIIFTTLLAKYSEKKSLMLNGIIQVIIFQLPILLNSYYIERYPFYYLFNCIHIFITGLILGFIFLKSKSILPGMIVIILTSVLGISIFFFFIAGRYEYPFGKLLRIHEE